MNRARLEEFRQAAYKQLGKAHDATFELTDAILLTRNVHSLADLSLSPGVVRLRSNLCLWGAPAAYSGKGRPRKQGSAFKLNDPATWGAAASTRQVNDPKLGRVQLSLWTDLHFRQAATRPMSLLRVERLDENGHLKVLKPLWLAWVGEQMPALEAIWRLYLRRFTIDHWYRFLKQRLHWTVPKFTTPEQCEHWSHLMPLMTWELWLARELVADRPLPWHKPLAKLTPGRVAQAMGGVLATIGTPTCAPKPRGKSPGWTLGQPRIRKIRYPIVKKTASKPRQQEQKSA